MDRAVAEREDKKLRIADAGVFILLLTAVSAVTLALFYRQCRGEIHSDMKAYILEMQGLDSGYSFPYPVFFKLSALVHLFASPELAVAVAAMALNSLAMGVTKGALNRMVLPFLRKGLLPRVMVSLLSLSLFFISMLYPPEGIYLPGIRFKYLGVFTANPFHNATYMAARPFAILAFLWYVKLLPVYEKGFGPGARRDYVLFSLFLLIATMTKPSFTLVMVSACGLLMLYRLFRARFRNFVPSLQLGICFLPTFLALLYQYKGVFVPSGGEEGGVGFGFGEVWTNYCGNIPLAVALAVGFPLLALALNLGALRKNTLFRFSWLLYVVSFGEAFLLYEKGFRKIDFNFSWGYMYGIFFCHFTALILLLQNTGRQFSRAREREEMPQGQGRGIRRLLLGGQWLAYLWHLACGLLYFRAYFGGAMYY